MVSQQGKCLCNERQTGRYIDEEEDGHEKIQCEKGSSFKSLDVVSVEASGQEEVDWCYDERDDGDGQ